MCVKCQTDGELPAGRKKSHKTNAWDLLRYICRIPLYQKILYVSPAAVRFCKGGIFYEKITCFDF